jgi:hypothetical protein
VHLAKTLDAFIKNHDRPDVDYEPLLMMPTYVFRKPHSSIAILNTHNAQSIDSLNKRVRGRPTASYAQVLALIALPF